MILSVSRITPESFNHVAGIVSGLLVVAIGGWLFVRQGGPMLAGAAGRLASGTLEAARTGRHAAGPRPDGHAHGTRPATTTRARPRHWHEHGGRGHSHLPTDGTTLTWRSLFALGLFGGLVPSINALIILLAALATGRAAFGFVLVVAFGAGMAIVLGDRPRPRLCQPPDGRGHRPRCRPRLFAVAPAVSAVVILPSACDRHEPARIDPACAAPTPTLTSIGDPRLDPTLEHGLPARATSRCPLRPLLP